MSFLSYAETPGHESKKGQMFWTKVGSRSWKKGTLGLCMNKHLDRWLQPGRALQARVDNQAV